MAKVTLSVEKMNEESQIKNVTTPAETTTAKPTKVVNVVNHFLVYSSFEIRYVSQHYIVIV